MTQQLVKWGEIRSKDGEPLWTLWLNPSEIKPINSTGTQAKQEGDGKKPKEGGGETHDPMTDAQKRYLFRLLAERGVEGDDAYRYLKKTFGVEYLKDVGKLDASRVIDQLVKGEREVNDGSEDPFP